LTASRQIYFPLVRATAGDRVDCRFARTHPRSDAVVGSREQNAVTNADRFRKDWGARTDWERLLAVKEPAVWCFAGPAWPPTFKEH
jgi:hypothetical protein